MKSKLITKYPRTQRAFNAMLKTAQQYMPRGWNEQGPLRGTYSYWRGDFQVVIYPPSHINNAI